MRDEERSGITSRRPSPPSSDGDLFVCPVCGGSLSDRHGPETRCLECARTYPIDDGIPLLFCANEWDSERDVTAAVQAFYDDSPFPDYEELDDAASLKEKARRGIFARLLDEQLSPRACVLDAGCGTGQLTNFLGLAPARTVVGADLCLSSLRLAQQFRRHNRIDNVTFAQMNLFRPALRSARFDLVISNGVLHHTSRPFDGLMSLSRLVKPGGHLILGLYNTLGRLPTDLRRGLFRLTGDRFQFLDPRLRTAGLGTARRRSWFRDQYKHPHESKHSIDQALRWLDAVGMDFVNAIPKLRPLERISEKEALFQVSPRGSRLDHLLVELGMLLAGGREGGLFVVIGRKRNPIGTDAVGRAS